MLAAASQVPFLAVLLPARCSSPGLAWVLGRAVSRRLRSLFLEAGDGAATVKSLRSSQSSRPQVAVRVLEDLLPLALQNSCVHWAADTGLNNVRSWCVWKCWA